MKLVPFDDLPVSLVARWIEALRSGEYMRSYSHLYKDGKFCPLGILAHIQGMSAAEIEARNHLMYYTPLQTDGRRGPCYLERHISALHDSLPAIASFIQHHTTLLTHAR